MWGFGSWAGSRAPAKHLKSSLPLFRDKSSMHLNLATQPQLLRYRFAFTREALLGVWVMPADLPVGRVLFKHQIKRLGQGKPWLIRFLVSLLVVSGLIATIFFVAPNLYYQVIPGSAVAVSTNEDGTPLGGKFEDGTRADQGIQETTQKREYQPAFNPDLPTGEWLSIPRIGVRSSLVETKDSAEALKTGLWLVPGYGHPGDNSLPIIVAAHRFGWNWWWQSDYWQYNSFYRLPETEPGDMIEVIADQRKWIFEIYAGEEVDEITDYDADLILYTCKFLNSPIRHIRYARLIDPTKDTQSASLDNLKVRFDK